MVLKKLPTAQPAFLNEYRERLFFKDEWPNLIQMFAISADRFPTRSCFMIFDDNNPVAFTYQESYQAIVRTAKIIQATGVAEGDTVALVGLNSPEWMIAYLAILYAGAVVVPLDVNAPLMKNVLLCDRASVKLLFADDDLIKKGMGIKTGETNISLTKDSSRYILDLIKPLTDEPPLIPEPISSDALAAIMFTSGTTGNEKGVKLSHTNLVADAFCTQMHISVSEKDVFYAILPIHHAYCMQASVIIALTQGAGIVFAKTVVVAQMMKDLSYNKITILPGIPLLFNKLLQGIMKNLRSKSALVYGLVRTMMILNGVFISLFKWNMGPMLFGFILKKAYLTNVRAFISGGGPISPTVVQHYLELGLPLVQGYGLTETAPIVTLNPSWRNRVKSIGLPVALTTIEILNPDQSGIGEIVVKGPMVFEGYYKNPEATAAVFTPDGFFKTGDLGYKDRDNYVYITGRAKNIIVTEGGKNVSPEEVEDTFEAFSEIEQILVRGYMVNEELKIEGIEAVIYLNPEFTANWSEEQRSTELISIIREGNKQLSPYQRVMRVRMVSEPIEVTSTKKLRRHTVSPTVGTIIL